MDTTYAGRSDCSRADRVTRSLLGYGVLAGPFYVGVVLAQAWLRPGFDLAHDDASLLSNGSLGWIQVANFLLTGGMVVACAMHGILRRTADAGSREMLLIAGQGELVRPSRSFATWIF